MAEAKITIPVDLYNAMQAVCNKVNGAKTLSDMDCSQEVMRMAMEYRKFELVEDIEERSAR